MESKQPLTLEQALDRARNFRGTKNTDWQPIIMKLGEIDPSTPMPDLEMCLVPVGKFMMGDDEPFYGGLRHEQVIEQPYWIARYPVTNQQWQMAVSAEVVAEPKPMAWGDSKWYLDKTMEQCPVVDVNWFDCLKFAQWIKCNLPIEPLWEFAARGVESWVYPWGNDWEDGDRLIWGKNSGGKPNPVSSKPEGASWVGAMHLSGNVWEWQLSAYGNYPYVATDGREGELNFEYIRRIYRGGSWDLLFAEYFHASRRPIMNPLYKHDIIGFRVS